MASGLDYLQHADADLRNLNDKGETVMEHRYINGIEYLLDFVSIADIKALPIPDEVKKANVTTAMASGGLYAATLAAESIPNVNALLGTNLEERDYPIITIMTDVSNYLDPAHVELLIRHEEAHVMHGDADKAKAHPELCHEGILNDLDAELIADAYAATFASKEEVRAAIYSVIKVMSFLIAMKASPTHADEYFNMVVGNPIFQARMAALQ